MANKHRHQYQKQSKKKIVILVASWFIRITVEKQIYLNEKKKILFL